MMDGLAGESLRDYFLDITGIVAYNLREILILIVYCLREADENSAQSRCC